MRVSFLLCGVGFRAHPESGLTRLISPVAWSDPLGHAQEGLRPLGGPTCNDKAFVTPDLHQQSSKGSLVGIHIYDDPQ